MICKKCGSKLDPRWTDGQTRWKCETCGTLWEVFWFKCPKCGSDTEEAESTVRGSGFSMLGNYCTKCKKFFSDLPVQYKEVIA